MNNIDNFKTNREKLVEWIENKSKFNWTNICNWLACIEASTETPEKMQELARSKMKAVIKVNFNLIFTILSSIFNFVRKLTLVKKLGKCTRR